MEFPRDDEPNLPVTGNLAMCIGASRHSYGSMAGPVFSLCQSATATMHGLMQVMDNYKVKSLGVVATAVAIGLHADPSIQAVLCVISYLSFASQTGCKFINQAVAFIGKCKTRRKRINRK